MIFNSRVFTSATRRSGCLNGHASGVRYPGQKVKICNHLDSKRKTIMLYEFCIMHFQEVNMGLAINNYLKSSL